MLYDQAMLALAYLETYQVSGKEIYADTAREIFTYVLRDMTHTEGGFYSAEDADSGNSLPASGCFPSPASFHYAQEPGVNCHDDCAKRHQHGSHCRI